MMASGLLKRKVLAALIPLLMVGCGSVELSSTEASSSLPAQFKATFYRNEYFGLRESQGYSTQTPTTGFVPILVIPVSFTDYPCEALPGGCDKVRADIETAFFGDEEDTTWHSVCSFYETSSYHQLHFYGEVAPWFVPDLTVKNILDGAYGSSVIKSVMRPAITWYRNTFNDDLRRFDCDGDGYLDAVYLVHSVPANSQDDLFEDEDRLFWAYTSYDNNGARNVNLPGVFHFGWSSYDFMYKDGIYERDEQGRVLFDENNKPTFHPFVDLEGDFLIDAHTFIHEFGHFLGLPDYYSYDEEMGDWNAAGGPDMMDYNVGDHNAFSKAAFGWIRPTVVTDATTIYLRPLVTSGDFAIVPIRYDDTILDEYLLIEYYRPVSINERDSIHQFAGRYPKTFSASGIKIYHVDARIGRYYFRFGDWVLDNYVDDYNYHTGSVYYGLAHSNTASRSGIMHNKLLHLLESNGQNSFRHGSFATNDALFGIGRPFNDTTFPDFRFNRGEIFPFDITITALDDAAATIVITRKA